MHAMSDDQLSRRAFLGGSAAASMALVLGACGGGQGTTTTAAPAGAQLAATPHCDDGDDHPTEAQTEGPFFEPGSPRRRNLVVGAVRGTPLAVTGLVLDRRCRPIAGALLDFWQADAAGRYDNVGYRLRGHQFADHRGRFALRTIVPGLYPGRTRHIHVKAQRPHGRILTTQLYFPGEPRNRTDSIFDDALLMSVRRAGGGRRAAFTFVLA
jgi:protocatechuate 3,4-dioxygenase beta subunit